MEKLWGKFTMLEPLHNSQDFPSFFALRIRTLNELNVLYVWFLRLHCQNTSDWIFVLSPFSDFFSSGLNIAKSLDFLPHPKNRDEIVNSKKNSKSRFSISRRVFIKRRYLCFHSRLVFQNMGDDRIYVIFSYGSRVKEMKMEIKRN